MLGRPLPFPPAASNPHPSSPTSTSTHRSFTATRKTISRAPAWRTTLLTASFTARKRLCRASAETAWGGACSGSSVRMRRPAVRARSTANCPMYPTTWGAVSLPGFTAHTISSSESVTWRAVAEI
jgi:hypothetical protein